MSKPVWQTILLRLIETLIRWLESGRRRLTKEPVATNSQPVAPHIITTRRLTREDVVTLLEQQPSSTLNLSYTRLSQADLSNLDLTGTNFAHSRLRGTNLSDCLLKDADFSHAYCPEINFERSNLSRSNFSNAYLRDANLFHTNLYRANMDGADLHDANLENTNLYRTSFNQAKRLYAKALGSNIIQDSPIAHYDFFYWLLHKHPHRHGHIIEQLERYKRSRLRRGEDVYRNLKTLFLNNGRYADASWAYIRERQTRRKMHAPIYARHYFPQSYPATGRLRYLRRLWFYGKHLVLWLLDWLAELSCGYGERPLNTIFLAFASLVLFPILYRIVGGIEGATTWLDYFNYSLATFTTIGFSQFTATTPLSQTITSLEALLGIALLALLMFVLGNRISKA